MANEKTRPFINARNCYVYQGQEGVSSNNAIRNGKVCKMNMICPINALEKFYGVLNIKASAMTTAAKMARCKPCD